MEQWSQTAGVTVTYPSPPPAQQSPSPLPLALQLQEQLARFPSDTKELSTMSAPPLTRVSHGAALASQQQVTMLTVLLDFAQAHALVQEEALVLGAAHQGQCSMWIATPVSVAVPESLCAPTTSARGPPQQQLLLQLQLLLALAV